MSSIAKFDVEKFDGSNDFGLWRVKMRCLLIQHGWEAALDPFPKTMADAEKTAALKTADVLQESTQCLTLDLRSLMLLTSLPILHMHNFLVETLFLQRRFAHFGRCSCLASSQGSLKKRTDAKDDGDGLYMVLWYASEGYDNGDLLMAVSEERLLEWIMDSGGSFHMTPRRDFLFDFKEFNGGTVLLSTLDREGYKFAEWMCKVIQGFFDGWSGTYKGKLYSTTHKNEALASSRSGSSWWKTRKESGIARHLTVAGTPQQIGLAERMNKSLDKVRSPSTTLEKKTPMDLWSGHPANYEMLRIFGCLFTRELGEAKPRAIKCIFLGYPDGSLMYKDTLKGAGAADSGKEVEFEVELQGSRVEPTVDPHTRENPGNEDEEQDERPQQQNLDNYVLVRDRAKRTTIIPARYRDEDDMLIAYKSKSKIKYTKGLLCKEFDMKELGPAGKILGIEIVRDRGSRTLKVSQSGYVQKILNNYRVNNGNSVSMPLRAHFKCNGRDQGKHVDVDGFMDADYAKDPNKGRLIIGYVFMAEYMALMEGVKESIWLKGLLIELGVNLRSVVVNCDNQSAIHLSRNAMFQIEGEAYQNVELGFHFIREIVESKEIEVAKIGTKDNAADTFTKVVPRPKFKYCMKILGVGIN
ncbi:retrovirus-related pol polyprotein from transposon TNT 1-94 [Tanacetum coccineum]